MSPRLLAFLALAFALAALFVRLGFWQLDRLGERHRVNVRVRAQLEQPPLPFDQLGDDTAFRRVVVSGTPDVDHEFVHVGRSRNGSPGVHIVTPVLRPGNDTAVLVNRGWVYAPDAATADLAPWREHRTTFHGFIMPLDGGSTRGTAPSGRRVRVLSRTAVAALLPYPVAPVYVVAEDTGNAETPARLARPVLNDGPHLSYAVQWFCFAAIAVVGALIVAFRVRPEPPRGAAGA